MFSAARPVFPGERHLRLERAAVVDTMAALEPADFEKGPTLCAAWSPRDVLAHLLSVDSELSTYLRHAGRPGAANAEILSRARRWPRAELLERAHRWAARPAASVRPVSALLLGELVIHHQDVLRPRGIGRELPAALARASFAQGLALGGVRRLRRHRTVASDRLVPDLGWGPQVRGTTEALGMWLAGRDAVAGELEGA